MILFLKSHNIIWELECASSYVTLAVDFLVLVQWGILGSS